MKQMKKLVFLFILSVFLIGVTASDADAQVRKKRTSTRNTKKEKVKEEKVSLMEKLNPEIYIGNLGFFNGFYVSTKLNIGYKLSDRFSVGAGGKLFYNQYAQSGPDPSLTDLGALVYGRAKITNEIYFQAEYDIMRFGADPTGYNIRGLSTSESLNYPALGLGYTSGIGKWRFGLQLLYIANGLAQDYQGAIVEYWAGGSYNF